MPSVKRVPHAHTNRELASSMVKSIAGIFPGQVAHVNVHNMCTSELLNGNDAILSAAQTMARTDTSAPVVLGIATGVHQVGATGGEYMHVSWIYGLHHATGIAVTTHTVGVPVPTVIVKSAIKSKFSVFEALLQHLAPNEPAANSAELMLTDGAMEARDFVEAPLKLAALELSRRVDRKQQAAEAASALLAATITQQRAAAKKKMPVDGQSCEVSDKRNPWCKDGLHSPRKQPAAARPKQEGKSTKDSKATPRATPKARPRERTAAKKLSPGEKWLKTNPLGAMFGLEGESDAPAQDEAHEQCQLDQQGNDAAVEAQVDHSYHELVSRVTNIANTLVQRGGNTEGIVVAAMARAQLSEEGGWVGVDAEGGEPALEYAREEVKRREAHLRSNREEITSILFNNAEVHLSSEKAIARKVMVEGSCGLDRSGRYIGRIGR